MFEAYKNESIFDRLDLQFVKTENNDEIEIKQEIKYDYVSYVSKIIIQNIFECCLYCILERR